MSVGTTSRNGEARVVVAEGHGLLREVLVAGLLSQGVDVVASVVSVPELCHAVSRHRPGAVLVDEALPPSTDGGVDGAAWVKAEHPTTAVLVLSDQPGIEQAARLLSLQDPPHGVGILLRGRISDLASLVAALRRTIAGEVVVDPTLVSRLLRAPAAADPLAGLTAREREVLSLLAQGRSNACVARTLSMAVKTVEKCITSIYVKLGLVDQEHDADVNTRVLAVLAYLGTASTGARATSR